MNHEFYMRNALNLARRGVGQTAPNPSVGCVIVKNDVIISRGATDRGGRPHAERIALDIAGREAENAIAYVTLEPCSHHGKTPPCAKGLIDAEISKVVIACSDPDPRVNGKGIEMLRKAGIEVITGVLEKDALEINRGFFKRIKNSLPFVTMKIAISADGKYAEGKGKPIWVTGEVARNYVHLLRAQNNVIITGTGTVIADNPQLNVRLQGMEELSPQVIVVGKTKVKLQKNWQQKSGNLKTILQQLAEQGINNVMVEAGPGLSSSFIKSGLVDELVIIQSPKTLGKKGKDYLAEDALKKFRKTSQRQLGEDMVTKYGRA